MLTAGEGAPSELLVDLLEGRWQKAQELALAHLPDPWVSRVQAAIMTLGAIARYQGRPDEAWEYITRSLTHGPATEPGDSWFAAAICTVALAAELALDAGDLALAQAWIDAHERWLTWSDAILWQPHQNLLQARFHLLADNLDDARRSAEIALAQASEPRQPLILIAIHRLLGELALLESRVEEADAHLQQSLALAEACAAPYEQALTLLALAELRLAAGEPVIARSNLNRAHEICTPLAALPALQRIQELESRLAIIQSAPVTYPAGLTKREAEVLGLIASGKSNREMAAALFLSPRTVERHIANIYLKLDVHNKAEATAYARQHRLA